MTLEVATYINGLNSSYPEGGADRSTADDHLRLIKAAVKATFPSITGPVTVTHTELNLLTGVAETIGSKLVQFSLSISGVKTEIGLLSLSISQINTTVSLHTVNINSISNTVSVLNARIVSMSAIDTSNAARFASLSIDVAKFSLSISAINSAIALLDGGLTADLNAISNTISVMAVNIAAISNTVSVMAVNIAAISNTVSVMAVRINTLSLSVATAEARLVSISALNTTYSGYGTTLTAHSNTISVMAVRINTLSLSVATAEARLVSMSALDTAYAAALLAQSNTISVMSARIVSMSADVVKYSLSISALNTRVNTLSATVSLVQAQLTSISAELVRFSLSISALGSQGLIAESVLGAPSTSVAFTGLNMTVDRSYKIEIEAKNGTTSVLSIYMFFNADTTVANYNSQRVVTSGATVSATAVSAPAIGLINGSEHAYYTILVQFNGTITQVRATAVGTRSGAVLELDHRGLASALGFTTVSTITIQSAGTADFDTGSQFRLYKG